MPTTQLIVSGSSILGDPKVNVSNNSGGIIKIHDGTALFSPDAIVVFDVTNTTLDGQVTTLSQITKVTAYANATDYLHGVTQYTYTSNLLTAGTIPLGTSGMGDSYLRFNANGLTSTDPNAPLFKTMILAPGYDMSNVSELNPLNIARFQTHDYNGNGQIDLLNGEAADGLFSAQNNIYTVICLVAGARIATPSGEVAIERLAVGDLVHTRDAGPLPIRWIGRRTVPALGRHAPIGIRSGTLGNARDLWVSPNHRMMLSGARAELLFGEPEVLVAAKHLTDGRAIRQVPMPEVTYVHFLFDSHQIVYAEGCPTESLYPGTEALNAVESESRAEIVELFPELATRDCIGRLSRYELNRREAQAWKLSA